MANDQDMTARRGERRTICEACGKPDLASGRTTWTEDGASFCPACHPKPDSSGLHRAVARRLWDINCPDPTYDEALQGAKAGDQSDAKAIEFIHDLADAAIAVVVEQCAGVCHEKAETFLSPKYATNQPLSSVAERFACGQCAAEIRALARREM